MFEASSMRPQSGGCRSYVLVSQDRGIHVNHRCNNYVCLCSFVNTLNIGIHLLLLLLCVCVCVVCLAGGPVVSGNRSMSGSEKRE